MPDERQQAMAAGGSAALPPLAAFGITRVGDITDLDVIGLPVWFATRPNSRSLSVSQGKGLTHEQARISAVMEAVEGAVSEQTRPLVAEFASPAEMAGRGLRIVPLEKLIRCRSAAFDARLQRAWVRGHIHRSGETIHAPYELVGLDMRLALPWDHRAFHMSSVGLGAGPSSAFASVTALLELVEHDATSLGELLGHQLAFAEPLRWEAGVHAGLDAAVRKVQAAGLEPRLFNYTNRIGIPVVGAIITRPVLEEDGGGFRFSGGKACRLDAGEAALAALLEAVQSRLTNIAGSRDDMEPSEYEKRGGVIAPQPAQALTLAALAARYPAPASPSPAAKLEYIVERLEHAGHPDIFIFDLPARVEGVHVVRALIPGLKTFVEGSATTVGIDDLGGLLHRATA